METYSPSDSWSELDELRQQELKTQADEPRVTKRSVSKGYWRKDLSREWKTFLQYKEWDIEHYLIFPLFVLWFFPKRFLGSWLAAAVLGFVFYGLPVSILAIRVQCWILIPVAILFSLLFGCLGYIVYLLRDKVIDRFFSFSVVVYYPTMLFFGLAYLTAVVLVTCLIIPHLFPSQFP